MSTSSVTSGSPAWDLSVATIVIYGLLLPPTAFNLFKHNAVGGALIPGWMFLLSFILLQIIGSALQLAQNKYAEILLEVGIAPLLLASFSLLGESNKLYGLRVPFISDTIVNIGYQVFCYVGVALAAIGVVKVLATPPDLADIKFEKAGIVLLLVATIILTGALVFTVMYYRNRNGTAWLIGAVAIANVLLYARFTWSLIDVFTPIDPPSSLHITFSLPQQGGSMAAYICLEFLPGLLIAIIFDVAGFLSNPDKYDWKNGDARGKNLDSEMNSPQRPNYSQAVDGRRPNY